MRITWSSKGPSFMGSFTVFTVKLPRHLICTPTGFRTYFSRWCRTCDLPFREPGQCPTDYSDRRTSFLGRFRGVCHCGLFFKIVFRYSSRPHIRSHQQSHQNRCDNPHGITPHRGRNFPNEERVGNEDRGNAHDDNRGGGAEKRGIPLPQAPHSQRHHCVCGRNKPHSSSALSSIIMNSTINHSRSSVVRSTHHRNRKKHIERFLVCTDAWTKTRSQDLYCSHRYFGAGSSTHRFCADHRQFR